MFTSAIAIYKDDGYYRSTATQAVLFKTIKELQMKKFALIALTAVTLLSACNTISGAGKDVKAAGNAVSNTAESVKSY